MKSILLIGCLLFTAHAAWCGDQAPATPPKSGLKALAQDGGFSGKVVETTNTAGYTYILVNTGIKKLWAAATAFPVKVGDSVVVSGGMPMPNYHSKSMNRDFDQVYFTDKVGVNGASGGNSSATAGLPKDHPPIGGDAAKLPKDHPPIGGDAKGLPKDHPAIGGMRAKSPIDMSNLKKAEGGKTVAEIFAGKGQLAGQQVRVRGKVVKYNTMIMGKNWLHIQDGTGSAGSNDLVVTSSASAKLGNTVLITGKIVTNKDLGSGYKYDVMIEDAAIVVE